MTKGMTEMFTGSSASQQQLPPEQAKQFGEFMNPEILLDQPKLELMLKQIPAELLPYAEKMVASVRGIFSDALTTTFLAGAIIMAVAVVVALFLRAIPLVSEKDHQQQKKNS